MPEAARVAFTLQRCLVLSASSTLMRKYLQLTRPRIVVMVLFALAAAAWTSAELPPTWSQLAHAVLGMTLITAGSVALNQWYEQRSDALMARTQGRPIPSGRVPSGRALLFGVGLSVAGLGYLVLVAGPVVAFLAAASWVFYVACYTPLKSRTAWQLPVGAIAGAMPMLIGGAVAGALWSAMAWILFAIVFLWQFPHALAIGWIYRDQYFRAGLRVPAVCDPTGRLTGVLATAGALVLVPVSLLPFVLQQATVWFGICAAVCSLFYLLLAVRFWRESTDLHARQLLRASFIYLPVVLSTLLVTVVR